MKLCFLNPCRSFDANKKRIQFWGYDNTIEISFYVEADALKQLYPDMNGSESGFLKAFDTARNRIIAVAENIYSNRKSSRSAFILAAKDI